uniref:Uncharacterized protein n=1 Tax=Globodera rostochiensis TaxID=31243 RepID=A0A914I9I3_GLORO
MLLSYSDSAVQCRFYRCRWFIFLAERPPSLLGCLLYSPFSHFASPTSFSIRDSEKRNFRLCPPLIVPSQHLSITMRGGKRKDRETIDGAFSTRKKRNGYK